MRNLSDLFCLPGVFFVMVATGLGADINHVVLAVHGGIAEQRQDLTIEKETAIRAALEQALRAGNQELRPKGGKSLRAAVAAIKVLEDSPLFNAGKGSVFTSGKTIEMDAAVMEGKNRRAGGVAAVQRIRNPIEAALAVMEQTPYVLLVGADADKLAKHTNLPTVEPQYFSTDHRLKEYEELKARRAAHQKDDPLGRPSENRGTVGAVALDRAGNLAAGTSTGGLAFKTPGRVGDSGIIGAGTYADNRACAISATGDGEYFMRSCASYDVFARMFYTKSSATESSTQVIAEVRKMGGEGGLIVLDREGHLAMPFAASGMYRGFIDRDGDIQIEVY